MSWILFIFYLGFFVLIIKKIKFFDDYFLSKKILTLIFIIKISIGVSLNFIYKNYYGDENSSDIYKYFSSNDYHFINWSHADLIFVHKNFRD